MKSEVESAKAMLEKEVNLLRKQLEGKSSSGGSSQNILKPQDVCLKRDFVTWL